MDIVMISLAFAAGVLSFISPCVFPLVPAYISLLTGSTVKDGKIVVSKKTLLLQSISFILGFSIIFVLLGASASLVGQAFADYRDLIQKLSGLFIIIFGFQMIGWLKLQILMKNKSWMPQKGQSSGSIRSFIIGLAFGTGWTPCVGLVLSSILLLAGSSETMWEGISLLIIYSLGLGVPFIIISFMLTYSLRMIKKISKWMPLLSNISGWILIVLGVLLVTGQFQKISAWLARFVIFDITI